MMRRVREKFNLSNEPHVNMSIEDHMKRRYYTWRYNLHQRFLAYGSEEEALEHRPQTVGEDDWNYLVQLWQKDEWKKSSAKNKENRKKLKITHCAGTKAFSRIRYENLTRFSTKKTTWVGEDAKNAFDEMKKLKNLPQTDEESVELMSDDEIYDSVLSKVVGPPRLGYISGLGAGPKPKTFKAGQYSHAIVEEAKRRADEASKRADDAEKQCMLLANELTEMKENSAAQKYQLAGLQARQNETDELLKILMQQLSSTSSSMRSDE